MALRFILLGLLECPCVILALESDSDYIKQFMFRRLIITLMCAILCTLAVGQEQTNDTFTAIPISEAARYHIDFTRFFVSPEAERAQRAKLDSILKDLESLRGKSTKSAENLDRALRLNDQAQTEFYRHYAYLYLRNAINTTDE